MTLTLLDGQLSTKEMQEFRFGAKFDIVESEYAILQGQIELNSKQIFLHIKWLKSGMWSKEIYLDMLGILDETEKYIKKNFGVEQLFVMIDANDKKLIKFEMLFGFFPFYNLLTEDGTMLIMFKEI